MATAKQNNIALGAGSIATEKASTTAALYTNQKAPASYVSVGSTVIENGKTTSTLRRITNVADGAADTDVATIAQLNKVAAEKGTWKLTAGGTNSTTVNATNNTVDFSAAKDSKNGSKDYSNLTVSKGEEDNNVTIGLKKDVILGQAVSGEGGSLSVYQDPGSVKTTDKENGYDQLGSHTKLDGSTISIRYNNGTSDSDARGVVLGIANDSYADPNDSKKTVNSPLGYLYLQDGKNYYYIHGAMHGDTNYQGRLAYDTESSSNYIANLDDGLTFTGDTKNITVETKLDPNVAKNTLSIKGGVTDSGKLTSGNIGVVATANTTDEKGNVASAGGLSIQLAKNLTGITSISNQPTSATTTTGAKIELGTNGTTISGGDVNVSSNKITNLKNGEADTDAATVGQMNTAIGNAKTKYYSVNDKNSITQNTLPTVTGLLATNSDNLGAKGMGSLASGFSTEADGTLSTVGGSYSGVINEGSVPYLLGVDIRGTAAVSYGTGNMNKSTAKSGTTSGVANSLIGQVNDVTDSNAAIAIGAGNTISNSYRDVTIDPIKVWMNRHNPEALRKLMKDAVKESGGQVMVMGGGNNVESAYMSQVVGVGNTVKGNQVENTKGEWGTDSSDTAINDYNPEKSSQYNYVDGFNNEVINGKHDYVIGANNKLSGDSYDDDKAEPIKRSNKSNIVIGDNHILTREQNTVIIGSIDTENTQTKANDAVIIGHNANATIDTGADNAVAIGRAATATGGNAVTIGVNTLAGDNSITIGSESRAISGQNIAIGRYAKVDGYKVTKAVALGQKAEAYVTDGVAIGSGSIATVAGNSVEGYDPTTGQDSTDGTATWKATNAAVSIGTADGKVTRQINGVAAGTNDTDAVNVAQKLASINASNIGANLQYGADGTTAATDTDKTKNKEAWATAIGTGTVTKDDDGSKQMVTGSTVYNEVRPSNDGAYVKMSKTTGENLLNLDSQVKTNTDTLSDVNSRSVKYDTKTENGKTVVDNTKITLAGEGGTTITNLKDGVNANDAATVGQLDAKIAGVTYKAGDGIKYDTDADNNKTISVNKGDGLKFDKGKLVVDAGNGLKIDSGAVAIKTSDSNLKVDSNGIGLSDKITIGSDKTKQVTIDGTKGEISGLTNTTWDSKADYSKSTKAATESQVDAAVKDAVKQAGDNDVDTHVKAGSYGVDANHQVSMDIVDKNGKATGKKVTITDVATHTEVGDVTKLDKGVQNASGTTSVVDAINNVNTSMNTKIGDQKYSTSNTSGSNKYVQDGDSITSAIGKLDGAVQQATTAAGQHSTVSAGSNITVTPAKQTDGHTDYQVALNKDITVDSVTAKTATTDTLIVNKSANIDGVTIENKTISGLDDTEIEKDSKKAVNAGTIYNELRPTNNGSYIQTTNTTAQNLVSLDTQVKKTSDLINSDGKTIKIGGSDAATKIDVNGKDGKCRVITGVVSDANDPNSAANVGYVNGLTAANTQQIYRDMNNAYSRLDTNINRAAAGSNALAALHPLDFDPADKASFAVGYGHYRNANAAAVGAFYQPNANTMVNMGISLGNGDPGFNAGVSFKIGKGSAYNGVSKAEMAQTIHDQATEISAIKADDAAKDKRIDALEKENQEMKKQIQEILARLNG
ncbi:YadA-like family protein [Megasphaera elsdenii]|nr:YadA-like family protein [Megasphaera elsdenii]